MMFRFPFASTPARFTSQKDADVHAYRWPYFQQSPSAYKSWMLDYYYFMIEGYSGPFGYIHKSILEAFPLSSDWRLDKDQRFLTMVGAKSFEERSQILGDTLARAVEEGAPTSPRKFYGETLRLVSSNGEHIANWIAAA